MFDIYKLSVNELRLLRVQLFYLYAVVAGYKKTILCEELHKINQRLSELTGRKQYLQTNEQ